MLPAAVCQALCAQFVSHVQGLAIIRRNSEFVKLAATLVVSSLLSSGLQEANSQYLVTEFGFQPANFAVLLTVFGVGGFLVQVRPMQISWS